MGRVVRPRLYFEAKDEALRRDVSRLGELVGALVSEQCGEDLFQLVETVRRAAIDTRERTGTALEALPREIPRAAEPALVRAFSMYFQAVNLAERVHRIRRRRDWLREADRPQPGSLADALARLESTVATPGALQATLDRLRVEPVFTAHPTEPTRRTLLRKQQLVARRLVELMNPSLTPREADRAWQSIRAALTISWQTEEHPEARMSVTDEFEQVLFFLTEILYRVVPVFYENLAEALDEVYGDRAAGLRLPVILRFGSWVGGDMDGNPNVNADTARATLETQRDVILERYGGELRSLGGLLTQTPTRVAVAPGVLARCEAYGTMYPGVLADFPARHRNMPYRVLCGLMAERLAAARRGDRSGYAGSDELLADLALIAESLATHRGRHAGLYAVNRLVWRVRTFGFHLATLDFRQDALVHRQVVGRGLGDAGWEDRPPAERAARLRTALDGGAAAPGGTDAETTRCLEVFRFIGEARARYGERAVGPYIISMARGLDDVLSVLLLARWAGLADEKGAVPLDVTPLFETLTDLDASARVLDEMLADPVYGRHVAGRGQSQVVMIGYSDSNKDAGIGAARWALQKAEAGLSGAAERHRTELTVFHGRGGTVSRGGGKTHVAVMAAPRGAMRGRLRVTEQGEIINAKYGLRGIALRTLERAAGSVALASFGPARPVPDPRWAEAMEHVADRSAAAYRELVRDPDFYRYFRQATPVDVIERMNIGSRPASRRKGEGVADLRAIPWVFAWTQNRSIVPGWYGLGAGLAAAERRYSAGLLEDMFRDWLFMAALLEDVEMVLAKADMPIADRYDALADEDLRRFGRRIGEEFRRTVAIVLRLKGAESLLETDPVLSRAIRLRNPYVDPLSLLQIDLLRRWRDGGREDDGLLQTLLSTVNGIAHGLQNTG